METIKYIDENEYYSYEEAKRIFAVKGKIFNLLNSSHISNTSLQDMVERQKAQRSDFWIYETDTSIGSSCSPVYVDYQPKYAKKIDTESVSAGKLAYMKKRANKKGLTLVDYADGKRKLESWTCEFEYQPFSFGAHCLERYWQRSRMGNNRNYFKDFPKGTVAWLHQFGQIKSSQGYPVAVRRQYVPYEDGVFVAEILMRPKLTVRFTDKNTVEGGLDPLQIAANCVTFLHNSDLTTYQKKMVHLINERDAKAYQQMLTEDKRATIKSFV